jgi:apolipoprotein N-acyltransferase
MLGGYFELGPVAAHAGLAGVGLFTVAPFHAAFASWLAWRWRRGVPSVLAVAAGWALVEFARSHAPIPNPVGLVAYGAPDALIQIADLAGPWGIGALVAASAAALARAGVTGAHDGTARRALAGAAAALALAALYGHVRLAQDRSDEAAVRVAIVQGGVAHAQGPRDGTHLERYLALTREAAPARPELVLWPEFAVDFYLGERNAPGAYLRQTVRELDVELLTGANHYAFEPDGTRYYNSVFAIGRQGRLGARYDKTRLMPFAESAPLGARWTANGGAYTSGASPVPLATASGTVGAFVCGEALFPAVARELTRAGAVLLANPSNDHWFGAAAGAEQHLRAARLRAIENRRWLLRPTTTGVSAVIDPHGRVVARSRGAGPELLAATVHRSQAVTPVQRWGDAPVLAACGVVGVSSWRGARGSRGARKGDAG